MKASQVIRIVLGLVIGGIALSVPVVAQTDDSPKKQKAYEEFNLELQLDYRAFLREGLYPAQKQQFVSGAIYPEYYREWKGGEHRLQFTGFFRWETHETRRTHADIRELYWQWVKNDWELSIGAKKIFWGVTESIHLVDIVNQTDFVESFDGEQKLGQPMVHFSWVTKFGILDAFYLPWFRRRQFPGEEGRLRFPILLDKEAAQFESDRERFHPDWSLRWSHSLANFDLGLSHFYGTGREPLFVPGADSGSFQMLYPIIHQTGLEVQAVTGPMLWKFESILRSNDFQETVFAFAVGGEFTLGNIAQSGLDIGLLAEYLYDNRDELAITSMDNDLFTGARFAFNDVHSTEILMGGIVDLERSTKLFSLEASRRVGESWKVEIESRFFADVAEDEFLFFVRRDGFLQVRIAKFF
ncbi:MAG: hypothetical protein AAGA10_21430 [Bacteroidota bacterium]